MDFLRFFLVMGLLLFSAAAVDRSRNVIDAQRTAMKTEPVTEEDSGFIKDIKLAPVQPVSIVVQDGVLLGTGRESGAETYDPTAHVETEAIRDACRRGKTSVLKDGILYASRQPCSMCMSIIAHAGITKVVIVPASKSGRTYAIKVTQPVK